MRRTVVSLLLFSIICCVMADYPEIIDGDLVGWAGNNSIFYQVEEYFELGNIRNPLTLTINYTADSQNYPAVVCLNSYAQDRIIPGTHLSANCPAGGLATLSNNVAYNGTDFASHPEGTVRSTQTAQVYARPGNGRAGFIVTIPSSVQVDDDDSHTASEFNQTFHLSFTGSYCKDKTTYPVGSNGECIEIPTKTGITDLTANSGKSENFVVDSGGWHYQIFDYSSVNSGMNYPINEATFKVNSTHDGIKIYLQEGYYPTEEWYLDADMTKDDDEDTMTLYAPLPSTMLFVGIHNTDSQSQAVSFTYTTTAACGNHTFGKNCNHNMMNNDPLNGILEWSASLNTSATNSYNDLDALATQNSGEPVTFSYLNADDDDTTYDRDYAYIKLVNFPNPNTTDADDTNSGVTSWPYYVRVTVANSDISSLTAAPGIYAAWGFLPSPISSTYNISSIGDVTHQLILPVTEDMFKSYQSDNSMTWYIAVKLPMEFPLWVGTNCADCDNGDCYCNEYHCSVSNELSYRFPGNLKDSSGSCTCDNTAYRYSYSCTDKNNGNSVAYVCIIAVAGLLVLFVAIGVPVYCFIANKKKADGYEAME